VTISPSNVSLGANINGGQAPSAAETKQIVTAVPFAAEGDVDV
jgi:hypothetical protein